MAPASAPRVEPVAQPVGQQVEGHHRHHQGDAGKGGHPPTGEELSLAVGDHVAPARIRRRDPEAEERQRRFDQDRVADTQHALDQQRKRGGGKQVQAGQPPVVSLRTNHTDVHRNGSASLQAEVDAGTFDVYGVFGPYGDKEISAASSAAYTDSSDARNRIAGGDGQVGFDAFQFQNGPVPVVLGFEYRDEDFEWDGDDAGARVVKSVFAETVIPVFAPLEVGIAGRHDDYNDFGTTTNPKLTVQFRPLDSLLLRASYGTGFVAPGFDSLSTAEGEWFGGEFIDSLPSQR